MKPGCLDTFRLPIWQLSLRARAGVLLRWYQSPTALVQSIMTTTKIGIAPLSGRTAQRHCTCDTFATRLQGLFESDPVLRLARLSARVQSREVRSPATCHKAGLLHRFAAALSRCHAIRADSGAARGRRRTRRDRPSRPPGCSSGRRPGRARGSYALGTIQPRGPVTVVESGPAGASGSLVLPTLRSAHGALIVQLNVSAHLSAALYAFHVCVLSCPS